MKQLLKLKRNLIILLFPLSLMIIFFAKQSSFVAEEIFSKRIYRILSVIISRITGIFPFSVAEILLLLMPIGLTAFMIFLILHIVKGKGRRKLIIGKAFINTLCAASILYFLYVVACGVNYYRYPFSYYSHLQVQESTEEELFALCMSLAERTNALREQTTSEDEFGVFQLSMSHGDLGQETVKAYQKAAKNYPILSGWYPQPKPILFSDFMSRMEITGIYIPFTVEANVNVAVPDYSIPSTMCHEMAHQRGFMREDEANYIAYLVCSNSDQVDLQYSGLMQALIIAGNALYDKNVDLYREVSATYSNEVRLDLNANSEYWKQFENQVISNAAEQINNTYLMMNDQEDGIQSYGRMVDLLLAEYRMLQQ
jgi:hypothetical protein